MIDEIIKNINYQNCNCQGIKTYIPKSLEHYFVPGTEIGSKLIKKLSYNLNDFILRNHLDYDNMRSNGRISLSKDGNNIIADFSYTTFPVSVTYTGTTMPTINSIKSYNKSINKKVILI